MMTAFTLASMISGHAASSSGGEEFLSTTEAVHKCSVSG